MRRALVRLPVVLVLLIMVHAPVPAAGQAGGCQAIALHVGGDATHCGGSETGESGGGANQGGGRRSQPADLLKAVTAVDGQTCTILATPTSDSGQRELNFQAMLAVVDSFFFVPGNPFTTIWSVVVNTLPGCPGLSPEQVAVSFVTTIPLPKPAPYIAPGYAITGLKAYLETRASEQERFSQQTPLGPLDVVTTRTSYEVDWGDRTGKHSHPYSGLPWPAGRITHTYTDMGRYDVTVIEQWAASWSLGGQSGRITGLRSAPARIEDFEVTQLQAVRNR